MIGNKIVFCAMLALWAARTAPAAVPPPPQDCQWRLALSGAAPGDTLALTEYDPVSGAYRTDTAAIVSSACDTLVLTTARTGRMFSLAYRPMGGVSARRWPVFAEPGGRYRSTVSLTGDAVRPQIEGGVYDDPQMKDIEARQCVLDSLSARVKALSHSADTASLGRTKAEREKAARELLYAQERFVVYHPENGYSAHLVSEMIPSIPDLTTLDRVRRLYNSLNGGARNTYAGQVANEDIYALIAASPGASVPRFTHTSLEGEPVSPSQYRGRWVLLHFWAPDDEASRKANALLAELYRQYHPEGLEMIGIAAGGRAEAWRAAVRQDGLSWVQADAAEDLPGQQDVLRTFMIASVPMVVLVNPEGRIAFRGRPEGLAAELKPLFAPGV